MSFSISRSLFSVMLLAAASFGQVNTGRISGIVTDISGAVVPVANMNVNADPGFGTINSDQPPRQIQFGLTVAF